MRWKNYNIKQKQRNLTGYPTDRELKEDQEKTRKREQLSHRRVSRKKQETDKDWGTIYSGSPPAINAKVPRHKTKKLCR